MSLCTLRALGVMVMLAGCADSVANEQVLEQARERHKRDLQTWSAANVRAAEGISAFKAERGRNCTSAHLEAARTAAAEAITITSGVEFFLSARISAGSLLLDVADAAKGKGCAAVARAMYDQVVQSYTGLSFAALRERAAIGIQDLRGKA